MALRVELKPGERIILGQCVVTNGEQRTRLTIDGEVPILREKDILTPATADTPAKRIYLAVQLIYLATEDTARPMADYTTLAAEFLAAAPGAAPLLANIDNEILRGSVYKALKAARVLVAYEGELFDHARRRTRLRPDRGPDGGPSGAGGATPATRGNSAAGGGRRRPDRPSRDRRGDPL
jgi:flagellar protein FlbT